jgi:ferric-dicitrate binding protein FerR (iron transport regulator)
MSDPSKPFVVTTSSLVITATGTIFNIKDYDSKQGAETILVSGKVSVGRKSEYVKNEILSRLNPGERLLFEKQTQRFTIDQVDTYKYTAWKDGKLIFRNDPLRNVVERITKIYNVDIDFR